MSYPLQFKSQKEFDAYRRCFWRASVGDSLVFYTDQYTGLITIYTTPYWAEAKIIGKDIARNGADELSSPRFLLGSKVGMANFWPLAAHNFESLRLAESVVDFADYAYAYWVSPINVRVRRIKYAAKVEPVKPNVNLNVSKVRSMSINA